MKLNDPGKTCKKCRKVLTLESFERDGHFRDGLRDVCKDCDSDKNVRKKRVRTAPAYNPWR